MADFFRIPLALLRGIGKTLSILRSLVFNLLFIGIVLLVVFAALRQKEPAIPEGSILRLSIAGDVVEQRSPGGAVEEVFSEILGLPAAQEETVLQDIIDTLNQARNDPRIGVLLLDLEHMGYAGLDQLHAIGEALTSFRASNKPIVAAEAFYNQSQYFLAAHADKLYLNPMGGVNLHGFGYYRFFFKDALDALKINFHVFRVGDYKSAVEPFTRNSMSAEDRSQSRTWLNSLWETYVETVSAQRSLSPDAVNDYINSVPANLRETGGDLAKLALERGLIDEIGHEHEIKSYLARLAGSSSVENLKIVSFSRYLRTVKPAYRPSDPGKDTIGVIVAQGTILPGVSGHKIIGADTLTELIDRAAAAEHIKAVVLRLDSGGGSAFASEVVRQAVLNAKQRGKPVVVSMGSVCASGAYWLAADADEIWAAPSTLTGSIGIFMAFPTLENTIRQAGIHRDGIGTTNLSAALDITQPLSEEVKEAIQLTLEHGYRFFVDIVAAGRRIPVPRVEQLAQGKVYSGKTALELGLVDKLGQLPEAIEATAKRAGLDEYRVTLLEPETTFSEKILQRVGVLAKGLFPQDAWLHYFGGILSGSVAVPRNELPFSDPNGLYAHCLISYY